jgi:hypothetical protein
MEGSKVKNMSFAAALAAVAASTASAGFVGMNTTYSTVTQGFFTYHVFKVFAKFNDANDNLLKADGMFLVPPGYFWHNDFLSGGGSTSAGTWSPVPLIANPNSALDSWVTIGGSPGDPGNATVADAGWGPAGFSQAGIPQGAGWYSQNPASLQGRVDPSTLQTLVAQFVYRGFITQFVTQINLQYNQGVGTATQFAVGQFALIPAPGSLVLFAVSAGLMRRKRRG